MSDVDSERIRVFDGCYEMTEEGYSRPEPILHLFGRDVNRRRRHVRIEGFHPYFIVPMDDVMDHVDALDNDHRVRHVSFEEGDGTPIVEVDGRRCAKIVTVAPYHVPQIRENFEEHYEADVPFVERFLIDKRIKDTMSVPLRSGEGNEPKQRSGAIPVTDDGPVHSAEVRSSDDDPLDVPPRVLYFDIEVEQTEEGPSVVSERGIELAQNRIFAISAIDSYIGDQRTWVLSHESWDESEAYPAVKLSADGVGVYDEEKTLLTEFVGYVADRDFDVITAWNVGFDVPYVVNRLFALDHPDVKRLSPVGEIAEMNGSGNWINGDLDGRIIIDMIDALKKTEVHELDSYALENVASNVLDDVEKLDVDEQEAWVEDPERMVEYVERDTELVQRLDAQRGILA